MNEAEAPVNFYRPESPNLIALARSYPARAQTITSFTGQ